MCTDDIEAQDNIRAIIWMCISMLGYSVNDALIKLVHPALPMGEILFLRGLVTAPILLGFVAYYRAGQYHDLTNKYVIIRALAEIGVSYCFLQALFHMPLADAVAILQVTPIAVTASAAIFLGMRIGWRRWSAIVVGFVGVLLIIKPGFTQFNVWSLFAIAAVIFMVLRDLATRIIPQRVDNLLAACATTLGVGLSGLPLLIFENWSMPSGNAIWIMFGSALMITLAHISIIASMRIGDISVAAPFRFSVVIWALILGYIFWGDIPDIVSCLGIALLIGAGVYSFHRQRIFPKR